MIPVLSDTHTQHEVPDDKFCLFLLRAESVERTALSLESVDHVHSRDRLTFGVFGVRHSIANDILEKDLQDTADFFVDEPTDTFHTASSSQTTDSRFSDALNVVTEYLAMSFGTAFAETFAT